jgi:hypothetical protein
MFVRSRLKTVAAFAPPALPGFFAPGLHPRSGSFAVLLFKVGPAYSAPLSPSAKNLSDQPGSFTFTLCCSMLSATPERGVQRLSYRAVPFRLRPSQRFWPAQIHHDFGANYQIQRLTLHLATSAQLRVSQSALGAEFPLLALSIASRVPSCSLADLTHFDLHSGWLTTPFPEGYPPP